MRINRNYVSELILQTKPFAPSYNTNREISELDADRWSGNAMGMLASLLSDVIEDPSRYGSGISYSDGDGTSVSTAIVIKGAENDSDGINSEYKWLSENFPGSEMLVQKLIKEKNNWYDCLKIKLSDETTRTVYFDITEFFGKH